MPTLFTKIVRGDLPAHKIAESDEYLAFLDINPLTEGHALVIPKQETDYFFDLGDEQLGGIMIFARRVARALEATVKCERIGVSIIGLEVPHAHVHLIPIQAIDDMNFSKPKLSPSPEELASLAESIRANFE